jgi:hypothetical protein
MMYSEIYYPEPSKDRLQVDMRHTGNHYIPTLHLPEEINITLVELTVPKTVHCLEALRTSLMCYPDLDPHPYYYTGEEGHPISISAKVTRKCVNWEALQKTLEPRNFPYADLIAGTGPPH